MSNMDAIFISISKEGWLTLEYHREMVASFFANSPASHFLFFPLVLPIVFLVCLSLLFSYLAYIANVR